MNRVRKYRPSNGTEGDAFAARWCERCKRDEAFQADPENNGHLGCPIAANSFAFNINDPEYPIEWQYDDGPKCTAFEAIEP